MNIVIIMPTLNPKENFLKVVSEIRKNFDKVIIINDGSSAEYDEKFNKAKELGCHIARHEVNKGKGEGIKFGIREAKRLYPECEGVVTVDSDGQHILEDIIKVSKKLEETSKMILGTRDFSKNNIPFRNKFGNRVSSIFFKFRTGVRCPDTQTGLRGIPKKYFELSLNTPGSRFEYEMNFLTKLADYKIEMIFVPINTIYDEKGYTSHFRPVQDSILIYREQVRYLLSSILCAILDITIFHIITRLITTDTRLFVKVAIATVSARMVSGLINYILNKKWAFKTKGGNKLEALKYLCLFVTQMALSFLLVYKIGHLFNQLTFAKILVDVVLFVVSYVIQRKYIFKDEFEIDNN